MQICKLFQMKNLPANLDVRLSVKSKLYTLKVWIVQTLDKCQNNYS